MFKTMSIYFAAADATCTKCSTNFVGRLRSVGCHERQWVKCGMRRVKCGIKKCGMTLIGRGDKPCDRYYSADYHTDLSTGNAVKWRPAAVSLKHDGSDDGSDGMARRLHS